MDNDHDLQALLIGIDHYPHAVQHSLEGAVADAEAMYRFLLDRGVAAGSVRRLLSPRPAANTASAEPGHALPTYDNMVREIHQLGERAAARGGRALLCYSGHGGRVSTLLPRQKGEGMLDESLVPCDLGAPESRWLRDVELTFLLDEMLQLGVHITLVLDACHSGGMMRHTTRRSRQRRVTMAQLAPSASSGVATVPALEATWRRVHQLEVRQNRSSSVDASCRPPWAAKVFRHATAPASGWLSPTVLRRGGVTLLAACNPRQIALEHDVGGETRGALTSSLLQVLQSPGAEQLSWRQVLWQLTETMRRFESSETPPQTPQLEGDSSQTWFTAEATAGHPLWVTGVDLDRQLVRLGAGQALGLGRGALFELAATETHGAWRLRATAAAANEALAEVLDDGAELKAVAVGDGARCLSPGDGAGTPLVLLSADPATAPGKERILRDGRRRAAATDDVLRWLRQALEEPSKGLSPGLSPSIHGRGFLDLVESQEGSSGSAKLGWQLKVEKGHCRVYHWDGTPLKAFPEVPVFDFMGAREVVARLAHMARFEHLRRLHNDDPKSDLAGALSLQAIPLPEDWAPGDPMDIDTDGGPSPIVEAPTVPTGRWLALGIGSSTHRLLYLQVLALRWDWSVVRLYPEGTQQLIVEGPSWTWLRVRVEASGKGRGGIETLKVIATSEPMAMGDWSLPSLASPHPVAPKARTTRGGSEKKAAEPPTDPRFSRVDWYWTTAQLDIEVVVSA